MYVWIVLFYPITILLAWQFFVPVKVKIQSCIRPYNSIKFLIDFPHSSFWNNLDYDFVLANKLFGSFVFVWVIFSMCVLRVRSWIILEKCHRFVCSSSELDGHLHFSNVHVSTLICRFTHWCSARVVTFCDSMAFSISLLVLWLLHFLLFV